MYKFLLVAVLAFNGVFAYKYKHEHHHGTEEILDHVRSISHDAVNAIQNVPARDHRLRHIVYHEAHELAHNVHEIAYHLDQVVSHNYNTEGQRIIEEVVRNLYDIVHLIQRSLHHEPSQFQSLLRIQIENLVNEANKIGSVAQQQQSSDAVNKELLVILDDLLAAIQQFYIRSRIQYTNQQEVKKQVQSITNQVTSTIHHVHRHDDDVLHKLVHYAHHFAHHLGDIIHKIDRECKHYEGEVQNTMYNILEKIREIRSKLEKIERNTVEQILQELNECIVEIAQPVGKLIELSYSSNLKENESNNLKNVAFNVLARTWVAEQQLQRNVEKLVERSLEN